jgi:hypothetical protein
LPQPVEDQLDLGSGAPLQGPDGLASVVAVLGEIRRNGTYDVTLLPRILEEALSMVREADSAASPQLQADVQAIVQNHLRLSSIVGRNFHAAAAPATVSLRPEHANLPAVNVVGALAELSSLTLCSDHFPEDQVPVSENGRQLLRLSAAAAARIVRRMVSGKVHQPDADWGHDERPEDYRVRKVFGNRDKTFAPASTNDLGCWLTNACRWHQAWGLSNFAGSPYYPSVTPLAEELPRVGSSGLEQEAKNQMQLGARVVLRAFGTWQDVLNLATDRDWTASHLCHNGMCVRPGHLVVESMTYNNGRKPCGVRLSDADTHDCLHLPACIR